MKIVEYRVTLPMTVEEYQGNLLLVPTNQWRRNYLLSVSTVLKGYLYLMIALINLWFKMNLLQGYKRAPRKRGMSVNRTFLSKGRANAPDNDKTLRIMIKMWYYLVSWRQCVGRVVGLELRACVQTTTAVSAAGSSRRTAPHGPACRPAAPSQSARVCIL